MNSKIKEESLRIEEGTEEEELRTMPERLLKLDNKIYHYSKKLSEEENEEELLRTYEIGKISNEKTTEGKKVYSNEASRIAELRKRLDNNQKYIELKKEINHLKDALEKHKIQRTCLWNRLTCLRYIIKLKQIEVDLK